MGMLEVLDGIMAEGFDFDNSLFYVLDSIKIRPGKWVRPGQVR